MSQKTIQTLIAAAAVILAAIISGVFLLISKQPSPAASSPAAKTPSITTTLQNPYPPYGGTLLLDDPLNTSAPNWEESHISPDPGTCKFVASAYYASQPQPNHFTSCINGGSSFSNFVFEVQMTTIQGDCGGIIFDADDVNRDFYYFRICQANGAYVLDIAKNNRFAKTIAHGISSAFRTGLGQSNTIAVVVQFGNFDLYVNKQKLPNTSSDTSNHSARDTTYLQGDIGVLADNLSLPTEIAFNNAHLWVL